MTDFEPNSTKLSETAKSAIRRYIFALIVPSALVISIGSAAIGFIINEWARGQAYVKAYGDAISTILASAVAAGAAKSQAEVALAQITKAEKEISSAQASVRESKVDADSLVKANSDAIASKLLQDNTFRSSLANVSSDELKKISARISKPIKLQCKTASADSGAMLAPTVQASIPAEDSKDGYFLTTGGCELSGNEPNQPAGRAHNGPITRSKPNADLNGWQCRAMDPPNIGLVYSVRAWVVYCRSDIQ